MLFIIIFFTAAAICVVVTFCAYKTTPRSDEPKCYAFERVYLCVYLLAVGMSVSSWLFEKLK